MVDPKKVGEEMIKVTDKTKCSGCHACYNVCPKNCIQMQRDQQGFLYPHVDVKNCTNCGLCEKSCPIITPIEKKNSKEERFLAAAYSKDEDIRKHSSSGGVFSELAKSVFNDGGVVFGAVFNEDMQVVHKVIDNVLDLKKLQGSKYVQSTIGDTYKQVKLCLEENKKVLFTGTPCQIEGLYAYLKKDYENLYTQDIICHGVPSQSVWDKYTKTLQQKYGGKISTVQFRNKDDGWSKFNIKFTFDNAKEYKKGHRYDSYMQAFLKNLCLRPSCHNCHFKDEFRKSDITIADFWGIDKLKPNFNDDKGVSLLIVNSSKGKCLFEKIAYNLVLEKIDDIKQAIKYNPAMISSSKQHPNRERFMKNVFKKDFEKTVERNIKISLAKRALVKIKTILKNK